MAMKIASVGVSQGRISPKHPLLRWPVTVLKVVYQPQCWPKGQGRRGECFCVLVLLHCAADAARMLSPSQGQEVESI